MSESIVNIKYEKVFFFIMSELIKRSTINNIVFLRFCFIYIFNLNWFYYVICRRQTTLTEDVDCSH